MNIPFEHDFKVGDQVQLKLNPRRVIQIGGENPGETVCYDSPGMVVNALHTETNEPQCVWLGNNLQPYAAYFNPEILVRTNV